MSLKIDIPKPFIQLVAEQLTRMLARSLKNSPSADEIHFSIDIMAEDLYSLGYDESHLVKLEDAFNYYGQHAEYWPNTHNIMETVKSRSHVFREIEQANLIEDKTEYRKFGEGEPTPAYEIMQKLLAEIKPPEIEERKIDTINDVDHERLMSEDSFAGKIYRNRARNGGKLCYDDVDRLEEDE